MEMWNQKLASEHAKFQVLGTPSGVLDLRLILIVRISRSSIYVFHERQLLPECVSSYVWTKTVRGNIDGYVDGQRRATFLVNGFKLVLYYDFRNSDPRVTYRSPATMSVEEAKKFRPYAPIRIYRETSDTTQFALALDYPKDG